MSDWSSERVRALVAAAENAVQRTRWVFLVLTLGCAIMFTAQLNLYLPWAQNVHDRVVSRVKAQKAMAKAKRAEAEQAETESARAKAEAEAEQAEFGQKDDEDILRTINKVVWDDLYNVSLPLLGIKYSADDLTVLGTATMSILALWFVYVHRRENHCIGVLRDIAEDAKTKDRALASYIHAAIAHHFVFTTTTLNDEPYTELKGKKTDSSRIKSALRWHVIVLIHLPWVASLMAVAVMCASLFIRSKLAIVPDPYNHSPLFFQMDVAERVEAIIRMVWGLAFTYLTINYCFRAQKFDRDTHEMLREMENAASGN